MAHLIECPHCTSRFVTIFHPGKVERCPYCARSVAHSDLALRPAAQPLPRGPEGPPGGAGGRRAFGQ